MFKRLALSALTALSIAAPASAVPINVMGDSWMFLPELTGAPTGFFLDVVRQDREGDVLVNFTDEHDNRLGYAWVDCDADRISYDGGGWEYVDHRKAEGWVSDIACGRPVR